MTLTASPTTALAPATITLNATATDADSTIAKLVFNQGATAIATLTSTPYTYTYTIKNLATGTYSFTAQATDALGVQGVSAPANVTVNPNQPPTVSLTSPNNGSTYIAPANINLSATATAPNGSVAKVDFLQGTTLIGTATASPYMIAWTNVPQGAYQLTARVTDNFGIQTTSSPIAVTVNPNQPPTVSITSPTNNATFVAPANITITATATAPNGNVAKVDFFQGTTQIGTATTSPYTITWSNVPFGTYQLTAKVTDNYGFSTVSSPVGILVNGTVAGMYFVYTDQLNTPRAITDANNNLVWRWDNTDPYGANAPNQDPLATGKSFTFNERFPGQYFDTETGFYYNYFRDYDPGTGRYSQSDPVGLLGGTNTYSYVSGNPLSGIDPLGLWSTLAHDYFIDEFVKDAMPELVGQWGYIDKIKAGSAFTDQMGFQTPEFSYMHAMSSKIWNKKEAQQMMCNYVTAYINTYNNMVNSGDKAGAYFYLGMALHAVMDSTSPAHRGFQYWPNNPAIHGGWDGSPLSVESLKDAPPYRGETLDLMRRALAGDKSACGCP